MTYGRKILRMPSKKDNFGLSKSEFIICVDNLKAGIDDIITKHVAHQVPETTAYLKRRFSITRQESYDICMNTLLRYREKLIQDKIQYGNLRYLFIKMCINHFLDCEKKKRRVNEAVGRFLDLKSPAIDKEDLFKKLESVLTDLNPDQQLIIHKIYHSGQSMEFIAEELNISYANLRKKKERILNKMRELYFQKEDI